MNRLQRARRLRRDRAGRVRPRRDRRRDRRGHRRGDPRGRRGLPRARDHGHRRRDRGGDLSVTNSRSAVSPSTSASAARALAWNSRASSCPTAPSAAHAGGRRHHDRLLQLSAGDRPAASGIMCLRGHGRPSPRIRRHLRWTEYRGSSVDRPRVPEASATPGFRCSYHPTDRRASTPDGLIGDHPMGPPFRSRAPAHQAGTEGGGAAPGALRRVRTLRKASASHGSSTVSRKVRLI